MSVARDWDDLLLGVKGQSSSDNSWFSAKSIQVKSVIKTIIGVEATPIKRAIYYTRVLFDNP